MKKPNQYRDSEVFVGIGIMGVMLVIVIGVVLELIKLLW